MKTTAKRITRRPVFEELCALCKDHELLVELWVYEDKQRLFVLVTDGQDGVTAAETRGAQFLDRAAEVVLDELRAQRIE